SHTTRCFTQSVVRTPTVEQRNQVRTLRVQEFARRNPSPATPGASLLSGNDLPKLPCGTAFAQGSLAVADDSPPAARWYLAASPGSSSADGGPAGPQVAALRTHRDQVVPGVVMMARPGG